MSRDYAKRMGSRTLIRKSRRRFLRLYFVFFLIFLSIFLGILKYSGWKWPVAWHHENAITPVKTAEDIQFDFYADTPPSAQLKPASSSLATNASASPKSIEKRTAVGRYLLQLGTFKSENEATQMRVSLLLAGWEVSIVRLSSNGSTQYQVEQGPYNTLEQAKAAQQTLQHQGITSLIKE